MRAAALYRLIIRAEERGCGKLSKGSRRRLVKAFGQDSTFEDQPAIPISDGERAQTEGFGNTIAAEYAEIPIDDPVFPEERIRAMVTGRELDGYMTVRSPGHGMGERGLYTGALLSALTALQRKREKRLEAA